ncbi:MAG TPA: hypothetical protein VNV60_00800 [Holophagaceae bacterium]|jgi:hypothetical protein|nr:hypothetical protein [Holophagaceae bacterium]
MEGIRQDTRQAVEALQAQVARLRAGLWLLFLLLLGAGGTLAWQHAHPKVASEILSAKGLMLVAEDHQVCLLLTANGIRLVDDQGQPRAELFLGADGSGQLTLNDAKGVSALTATGGALTLSDAKKNLVQLATAPAPTIQLHQGDKVTFKQPWDAKELK